MAKYKSLRQMLDSEVVERVNGDYLEFSAAKNKDNNRARRYDAIYQALDNPELIIDEGSGKLKDDRSQFSNTYMPIGAAVVDAATSILYNNFFSVQEYLKIGTDNIFDWLASIKVSAHIMRRHREMKFRHLIYRTLLQACCFDYAITGVRWLLEEGYIPQKKRKFKTETYGRIKKQSEEVYMDMVWQPDVIDRSDVFGLNYFNCYHDPHDEEVSADPFKTCTAFIDVREEKIEDLKMKAKTEDREYGKYKNIDLVINKYYAEMAQVDKKRRDAGTLQRDGVYDKRRIEIKRYWARDQVVETAMDEVIWRKNISGIPLQRWTIFERSSGFKGIGILGRMERNQYQINASINNRQDYENLVTDPIAVLDKSILGASGETRLYHGRTFVSQDGDATKKVWIHSPGQNLAPTLGTDIMGHFQVIERVTISDTAQGMVAGGRTTATEINEVARGTDNKTNRMSLSLEETCLVDIYMHQFILEQMLLSREERFHYSGKHGDLAVVIDGSDYAFDNQPTFYAVGTSHMVNNPVQTQQFMSAVKMLATIPQLNENNDWNAIKLAMIEMLAPKHMESFIKSSGEPKPNIPAQIENDMFAQGRKVEISPANDDAHHNTVHESVKTTPDYRVWPEQFKVNLQTHINEHNNAQAMGTGAPTGQGFDFSSLTGTQDNADPNRGIRAEAIR